MREALCAIESNVYFKEGDCLVRRDNRAIFLIPRGACYIPQ